MKTKMLIGLVFLCLGLLILVADGYSATAQQKPKLRHLSEDVNVDRPSGAKDCPKFGPYYPPSKVSPEINYQSTCEDISPSVGTIIQHDQIGTTWYEFQKNGSMGRMISVTNNGYAYSTWMYTDHIYPPGPRSVRFVVKRPNHTFTDPVDAGPGNMNSGYCNVTHLHDGTPVVLYHETADSGRMSVLTVAESEGSINFNRHFDLPDFIDDGVSGQLMTWPKGEAQYDSATGRDYIHIVGHEAELGCSGPYKVAYERCYINPADSSQLICQTFQNGATRTYTLNNNEIIDLYNYPLSSLSEGCQISIIAVVSPVSQKVAVIWLMPTKPGECDYFSDVVYVESQHCGDEWIDGTNWRPTPINITNYQWNGGYERAFNDVSACYDYQDSLHIVFVTVGFDTAQPGYYMPNVARLYHWSKKTGTRMITSAIWEGSHPSSHNLNIAKMSISAQNPIYHAGGDSVFLYCIWTQFDSADYGASGWYTNGELYGCGSFDGGQTWGLPYNLTNTKTPGCAPGTCLSEHWSSLAQNMYDGDLHIQYICDRDPGGAIQSEGQWTENPVMYLHLSDWNITLPHAEIEILSPANWTHPPLKVAPGGSRDLLFQVFNRGNANLTFDVNSDNSCIQVNAPSAVLPPGDSTTVTAVVNGADLCNGEFICGNVVITSNEGGFKVDTLPVLAVVADDYYECPLDSTTCTTLENGVLRLYTNANSEEWIHDIGTHPDTTLEVFFAGGTIIATTSGIDTMVGRFMRNDWRAGVRDKLYTESCDVDWEPDFYIIYTKNIFILPPAPPCNLRWYWWEESKQIKLFKNTAPDLYKHLVIQYVTVKRHDPPTWWPNHPPFTGYEDNYIGMAEDIDCPSDTGLIGIENNRNLAGYSATRNSAWQKGWNYTGAHPEYNNYYAGIALGIGRMGESEVPYGAYNVKNHQYVYPNGGWGWKDGELYQLASTPGINIQDQDSLVDRSQVFTARKIGAGNDPNASYSYTLIKVIAPGGLSQLENYVDTARAIVTREKAKGYPVICGDCNGDGSVNLGDVVCLITYAYKNGAPPPCPISREDVNSSGGLPNLGDIVYLISYLYKGGPSPNCPGIWGP